MITSTTRPRIAAGLLTAVMTLSLSMVTAEEPDPVLSDALQRLEINTGSSATVTWDDTGSKIETLSGELTPPSSLPVRDIARDFLQEHATLFGAGPPFALDLQLDSVRRSPLGYHIRYLQFHNGLPVFDGSVEVHLGVDREIFLVHNDYVPGIPTELGSNSHTKARSLAEYSAVELAIEHFRNNYTTTNILGTTDKLAPTYESVKALRPRTLGVVARDGEYRLAYRFVLEARSPLAAVEYTVDAIDGQILSAEDNVDHATARGRGRVFDPNPVNALIDHSLRDQNDQDQAAFNPAYTGRNLRNLLVKRVNGRLAYFLKGPFVDVNDMLESPKVRQTAQFRGRYWSFNKIFRVKRQHNAFEHVMVYYHIDRSQRYIRSLGFRKLLNYPIRVDPHGLGGKNNSHYVRRSPIKKSFLAYGGGTNRVDHAEDADVILHEYGHAIQDAASQRKYTGRCKKNAGNSASEARALSEGFADYWATTSTLAASQANRFDAACMAEWVAKTKGKSCLRRVDTASRYPSDPAGLAGQCHTDGQIWSATLWDLHQKLGRETTDKLALLSHYLVKNRPKFVDNGEAIVLADKRLNDNNGDGEGDNKDEICKVLENRGISVKSCAIKCDSQRHAGGDTPVTVSVDLGQKSGSFDFYYETYFIKDQLKVRYQNRTLLDTGCVGASATETLNFNGNSKFVTVEVNPNCDGSTSGTGWVFEVRCPTTR